MYRFIYPVNLNYEIMDFKTKTLLLSFFIIVKFADNKLLKKKVRGPTVEGGFEAFSRNLSYFRRL